MLSDNERKIIIGGFVRGDCRFQGSTAEGLVRDNTGLIRDGIDAYDSLPQEAIDNAFKAYQTESMINADSLSKIRDTATDILSGDVMGEADTTKAISAMADAFKSIRRSNIVATPAAEYQDGSRESVRCGSDLHVCFGLRGFKTGCLYVVGGFTGCGKSAFALNLVQRVHGDESLRSLYFNMENDQSETYSRLHCFRNMGNFDIVDGPVDFNDAIRFIESGGYRFTVIDQLSFFDVNCRADDLRVKYKAMCQDLADLARRTNGIIVLCAQLNRSYMGKLADHIDDDGEWRVAFKNLDDTVFAESSDITRPAQAAVIVTRRYEPDSLDPAYWVVNVKSRSGDAVKCAYYSILDGIVAAKMHQY